MFCGERKGGYVKLRKTGGGGGGGVYHVEKVSAIMSCRERRGGGGGGGGDYVMLRKSVQLCHVEKDTGITLCGERQWDYIV